MTAKKILEKYLNACYEIHHLKIPDKYHGYIIKAMEEYGNSMKKHSTPFFKKAKIALAIMLIISVILLVTCIGLVALLSMGFMVKFVGI